MPFPRCPIGDPLAFGSQSLRVHLFRYGVVVLLLAIYPRAPCHVCGVQVRLLLFCGQIFQATILGSVHGLAGRCQLYPRVSYFIFSQERRLVIVSRVQGSRYGVSLFRVVGLLSRAGLRDSLYSVSGLCKIVGVK